MQTTTIPIWPQVPLALGNGPDDIPDLTIYTPEHPTGAAVIVCPGGGYAAKVAHEKEPVAQWLTEQGITACLLSYRVGPRYHHPAPWLDAAESIRLVRARSQEFAIDPRRIGVIGFSAGGHLAAHIGVSLDTPELDRYSSFRATSSRPDLMILVYPVVVLSGPLASVKSAANLLGDNPDPVLLDKLSIDRQVTAQTPPAFIVHAVDDENVPCQHSMNLALALRTQGITLEMHLYEHGGHGFGGSPMAPRDPVLATWLDHLAAWLRGKGFVH